MDGGTLGLIIVYSILTLAAVWLGWGLWVDRKCGALVKVTAVLRDRPGKYSEKKLKGKYVVVSVINHGPNNVVIETLWSASLSMIRKVLLRGKGKRLQTLENFQLPKKLKAGEQVDLLIPFHEDCFLKNNLKDLGVMDSCDREHWVPKKQINSIRKTYRNEFP